MKKHFMTKVFITAVVCLAMILGLIACDDKTVYTATFVTNGGSAVEAMTVTSIESAPETTRDGYTFDGWYTDEALTTKAEFPYTLTKDTTLYAKWSPVQYKVSFVTNGGSAVADMTVAVIESAPETTRERYNFDGWYTDAELTNKAVFPLTITAETTLYAKWSLILYKADFVPNGGSAVETMNVSVIETAPVTTQDKFDFEGWYTDEALTNKVTFPYSLNANTTFYAKWTPKKYAVNFITNGGSTVETMTVSSIESAPVTTQDRFDFDGWYLDEEFTTAAVFPMQITEETTLYAKWSPKPFRVDFVTNGGSAVETMNVFVIESAPATTRYAYTFGGWYTDAELTNAAQFPLTLEDDVTLYAKWTIEENAVAVTFDYAEATDGNTETERMIVAGDAVGELPVPTKFGYDFVGWFNGDTAVTAETVIEEAVTFVAQWTPKTITIHLDYSDQEVRDMVEPHGFIFKFGTEIMDNPTIAALIPESIDVTVGEPVTLPAFGGGYGIDILYGAFRPGDENDVNKMISIFGNYTTGMLSWYVDGEPYVSGTPIIADGDITAKVHFDTITVTYDPTEGSFVNPDETGVYTLPKGIHRSVISALKPEVYREHYAASWLTDITSEYVTKDSHYTCSWIEQRPHITLDPNGGTLHEDAREDYEMPVGAAIFYTIDVPFAQLATRPGYRLLGWYDQDGVLFTESDVYPDYENRTLTAEWEKQTFTVTFDYAGGEGTPAQLQIVFEEEIAGLPVPSRLDYDFGGWYDDQGVKVENGTVYNYTENITLTAMWVGSEPVTITLNSDGGNIATGESSVQIIEGKAIGELPVPERDMSIFVAWTYNGQVVTADTLFVYVEGVDEFVATYKEGYNKELVFAYTQYSGKNFYTVNASPDVTGEVIIPATYDDGEHGELPVSRIAANAFKGNTSITSVKMRAVTEIMSNAFQDCTALETVEFYEGIESIGSYAFDGCTSLSIDLVLPKIADKIGSYAFSNTAITSVVLYSDQDYSTQSANGMFQNCEKLTSIVIDNDLWSKIPSYFADGCTSLTEFVYTGRDMTTIGESAFRNTKLTSFTLSPVSGNYVSSIGQSAFQNVSTLTSVDFGNGSTNLTIRENAFTGTGLTEVVLTKRVKEVKANAFDTVTTVNITNTTLITGGANMFGDAVEHIYVPSSLLNSYKAAANWSNYADIISVKPAE